MTIYNNHDIKVNNGKFFIYSRNQARFFPISKINALDNIASDKSTIVENLSISN